MSGLEVKIASGTGIEPSNLYTHQNVHMTGAHTHTHTHTCSIPYSTVQTVSVHLEHLYHTCLQVLQHKLQRNPGPDTNTLNRQTGHMQKQLVLRAYYNLGSVKHHGIPAWDRLIMVYWRGLGSSWYTGEG